MHYRRSVGAADLVSKSNVSYEGFSKTLTEVQFVDSRGVSLLIMYK